jgi:Ca2+-transporting ATPase
MAIVLNMVQINGLATSLPPYVFAAKNVAACLEVRPDQGLFGQYVRQRQQQSGSNPLPEAPPQSAWPVFASQFKSLLIFILAGAAILAAFVGNLKDVLVISV